MEQGQGLEPKTKCFCMDGIMFCSKMVAPNGGCFPGVWDASEEYMHTKKGVVELGYGPYFLNRNPLLIALPDGLPDLGGHTTIGTTNNP